MAIATSCPNCNKPFNLADDLSGKRVRCPKCQQIFAVAPVVQAAVETALPAAISTRPLAPPVPEQPQSAAPEDDYRDADIEPARPRRRRVPKRRSLVVAGVLFIGSGVALGLFLGCTVGIVLWVLSKSEDPAATAKVNDKLREQPYHDAALHYTLDLPGKWQVMPAAEIQQMNAEVQKRMPGVNVQYTAGFRPKNGSLGSGSPYILVQLQPLKTKGMSQDDIEREVSKGTQSASKGMKQAQGAFSDVIKDAALNSMTYDRSRNRLVMRAQIDVVGGGKVQSLSVGHVGSEGIVMVHCYSQDFQFGQQLPVFEKINDSFEFDAGYEFRSSSRWNIGVTLLLASLGGVLIGGMIGGTGLLFYGKWRRAE